MPLLASPQLSFVACSVPLGRLLLRTCVRVDPSSVALAWTSARCMRRRRAERVSGTASQQDDRCNIDAAMPYTPASCANVGCKFDVLYRLVATRRQNVFFVPQHLSSPTLEALPDAGQRRLRHRPCVGLHLGPLLFKMFQTNRTNNPFSGRWLHRSMLGVLVPGTIRLFPAPPPLQKVRWHFLLAAFVQASPPR